jgi:integrase
VVRSDVRAYQFAFGIREGLLFTIDGEPWSQTAWNNWRKRIWQPACVTAGVGRIELVKGKDGKMRRLYRGPVPYDLRHSHASLLLHEGKRSPVEIADSLGHSVDTLFRVYSHVVAELAGRPRVPAEQIIAEARQAVTAEAERLARAA